MQLESGNLEADDSEIKQKFDNQRQLNVQLQEQKRWLEHELEQVCQISLTILFVFNRLKCYYDKLFRLHNHYFHLR